MNNSDKTSDAIEYVTIRRKRTRKKGRTRESSYSLIGCEQPQTLHQSQLINRPPQKLDSREPIEVIKEEIKILREKISRKEIQRIPQVSISRWNRFQKWAKWPSHRKSSQWKAYFGINKSSLAKNLSEIFSSLSEKERDLFSVEYDILGTEYSDALIKSQNNLIDAMKKFEKLGGHALLYTAMNTHEKPNDGISARLDVNPEVSKAIKTMLNMDIHEAMSSVKTYFSCISNVGYIVEQQETLRTIISNNIPAVVEEIEQHFKTQLGLTETNYENTGLNIYLDGISVDPRDNMQRIIALRNPREYSIEDIQSVYGAIKAGRLQIKKS